ncbi:MAG: 30S ribosomal protein S8 [Parcubacteria group bacterium]|nr:30S ribosomal protein S8 [Parcubacteria group bacterium]
MDPIADMIIQIKNASKIGRPAVIVPYSKLRSSVAHVLMHEGYLVSVNRKGKKEKKVLELGIAYDNGTPRLLNVRRISKLSRRVYTGVRDLKPVRQGHGRLILSTPKGILTGEQARKERVGGEALFEIW